MGTASLTYRCPSCSALSDPTHRSCSSCGFQPDDEAQTWVVESGDTPAPERRASRFDDRYDLIEEVGRGGMGIVYKAIDRELDEVIALKVLAPAAGANPDLVARFKHEVKVARRLTHPNVARLHDLLEVRGQLCLSMEFIEGRSLRALLADGPLGAERVMRYVRYLAPALDLAHGRGIVHRDLKPANVIIDPKDVPHILDFGIAKSQWLHEDNSSGMVGTPAYMAPEQWQEGAEVDGRADIYSFGLMLWEMLVGKRLFDHRNRLILMEMHRSHPPIPPSTLVAGLPPRLESIILRCLEKDPGQRFARASDILAELDPESSFTGRKRKPAPGRPVEKPKGAIPPVNLLPGRRGKVLVVDDEKAVRRALSEHLRERELVPLEATDGGQALVTAFREAPDLILLDIDVPVLDGIEVLRLLKNDPRTRDIPVIVMSGRDERDQVAFFKESGAATFLRKPIPREVLELCIERYFG